jgi:transposase-like protein
MAIWRRHTMEFKGKAVEQMKAWGYILQLARDLDIESKLLYTWKHQFEGRPEPRHANYMETPEETLEKKLRQEIALLKQALADRQLEIDFFQGALRRIEEGRQKSTANGDPASTPKSGDGQKRKAH